MKHLFTLAVVFCLGTFASAQIPSYVPTNGLVGWWPFNGNANDESGNGNHGTVNGATLAADRFGNAGKAYSFDGVDDWIEIPNFGTIDTLGEFSFSCFVNIKQWFIVAGNSSNFFSVIQNSNSSNSFGKFSIYLTQNSNQNFQFGNDCFPFNFTPFNFTFSLNNWYHLTCTYKNNIAIMYINGLMLGTNLKFNVGYPVVTGNPLFIGRDIPGSTEYANGNIDDIAIYNRALTAAEVQQLYLGNCTQPTFTAQPQNNSVGQGQTSTFAVQVDTTSTFQWQMNLGLGAGWVNIPQSSLFSGDTTATLSVQGRNPLDGAQFRCIATACQSDTSNAATLTVTSNSTTLGSVAGVPGKINYQGAAVDSSGKPMKNQTISLKLSVLDSSSTGAAAYVETHSTPTNGSGLFSLQIGGGTAVSGTFDSIPWANGRNKYLKTEVQQNGTWINLGTSQLVSVPYALHAGSASYASQAGTLRDSLGNAYQIKTVNGQPTLVSAPGNVSSPAPFPCGQAVTYAGESYPTVQIGTQCWFAKNLNVGTMIYGLNDQTRNAILEKYCYNDDPSNCILFGGLYQWAEAVQYQNGASNTASPSPALTGNVQGICPNEWHIPSNTEWGVLINNSGGNGSGNALKSTSGLWNYYPNGLGTNLFGFSILPGGRLSSNYSFENKNLHSYFWTSSDSSSNNAPWRYFYFSNSNIDLYYSSKIQGFSVRCLKD